MEIFIFVSSVLYLLGTIWHFVFDIRGKNKVVFIPTEYLYVFGAIIILLLYLPVKNDLVFRPGYFFTFAGDLQRVAILLGFLMIFLHAVAKDLEIRRDIKDWSLRRKKVVSLVHYKLSHKLIYLSIVAILLSLAFGEADRGLYLARGTNRNIIAFSAVIFATAFYRNLIHGNTWIFEMFMIPTALFLLTYEILKTNINVGSTTFVYFAFIVFSLTPLFLIADRYVLNGKVINKASGIS